MPASFWNNLERNYQQALAALKEQKSSEGAQDWTHKFPVKELMKRGALDQSRTGVELVRAMFQFFGVSSMAAWTQMWTAPTAAYRRSPAFRTSPEATAAWLRLGEMAAQQQELPAFDKTAFKQVLGRMRGFMNLHPAELQRSMVNECRTSGVALVFVKELPRTRVHGAVRWVGDNPIIQLSCRYKVEDIFWFTFFHEAGHVLLHGKRDIFLEDDSNRDDKEREADAFATSQLIPEPRWRRFVRASHFSESSVQELADDLVFPPGLLSVACSTKA